MESRVKLLGHPIHPMLVVFPLGLLGISVLFDLLYLFTRNEFFPVVSYWNIAAGVIAGLAAALFGLLDWLNIPGGTRAKTVGLWHAFGNVVLVLLFALAWFLRRDAPNFAPGTLPLVFELTGAGLSLLTGWLGGEMVYRMRVGVDSGAHLDAPNSLSGQPAERRSE
jgi:uncharacterized membrane protein